MTANTTITLDRTRPLLGIVVNPRARALRRSPVTLARLRAVVGAQGLVRAAHDAAELATVAAEFRDAGIGLLGIAGGDGTTSFVLTTFARVYGGSPLPPLALLRAGTMNTIANALGVAHLPPEALARRVVDIARAGGPLAIRERATIDVGDRLAFLFGTGVFRSFLDEYYAAGPDPSPLTAAKTLARIASSIAAQGPLAARLVARESLDIRVENVPWGRGPYLTVAAGTVDQVGLGFRPFHRAFERSDAFHLLALGASASQTLRALPRIHRGRPLAPSLATDSLVREATLTADTPDAPIRAMVDGDRFEVRGLLRLRVGPSVRILDALARSV
jgi:diacylglycerol kinase family enzyme